MGKPKKQNERGAGRKPKYNEPTVVVSWRVPKSKAGMVKKAIEKLLNTLKG